MEEILLLWDLGEPNPMIISNGVYATKSRGESIQIVTENVSQPLGAPIAIQDKIRNFEKLKRQTHIKKSRI